MFRPPCLVQPALGCRWATRLIAASSRNSSATTEALTFCLTACPVRAPVLLGELRFHTCPRRLRHRHQRLGHLPELRGGPHGRRAAALAPQPPSFDTGPRCPSSSGSVALKAKLVLAVGADQFARGVGEPEQHLPHNHLTLVRRPPAVRRGPSVSVASLRRYL